MKRILLALTALVMLFGFSACSSDADVTSANLSKDADNYKVFRQIVVYNAITDKYILEVDGWCSLGNHDSADEVSYTCKIGTGKDSGSFIKDIIKKSDNTFVFVHQLHPKKVSTEYYKVIVKPTEVLPNFELR